MIRFGNENENIKSAPFLIQAVEREDNDISFIVSLPLKGEIGADIDDTGISALNQVLSDCTPIYPDENNIYEIIFENYVLHMTRNESYTSWDNYEIRHGKYFIVFEKSRLLDSMPEFVESGLIKAICISDCKHYGIYCQNHVIDIIATNDPVIKPYSKEEANL